MSRIKLTERDLINLIRSASKGLNEACGDGEMYEGGCGGEMYEDDATWTCKNGKCTKVVGKGGVGEFETLQECEDSNCEERARPGGYGGGRGNSMSVMDTQALAEVEVSRDRLGNKFCMCNGVRSNLNKKGNCRHLSGCDDEGPDNSMSDREMMSAMDTQALNEYSLKEWFHQAVCCVYEGASASCCPLKPSETDNKTVAEVVEILKSKKRPDPTIFNPDDPDGQHSVRPLGPGLIKPYSKAKGITTESQLNRLIKRTLNETHLLLNEEDKITSGIHNGGKRYKSRREMSEGPNPISPICGGCQNSPQGCVSCQTGFAQAPATHPTDPCECVRASSLQKRKPTTKRKHSINKRKSSNGNNSNSGSGVLPICCYRPNGTVLARNCNNCTRPGFYCANCPPLQS